MLRPTLLLAPVLCAAVLVSACGSSVFSQPTPTTGTPTEITENFSGTLTVNGGVTFPFVVQQTGAITATLATLSPDASATIGLAIGTWNGAACQLIITNDAAGANTSLTGNATGTGNFCVRVYDVGKLTAPTGFGVSIVHY